jgi:hypothetical protein
VEKTDNTKCMCHWYTVFHYSSVDSLGTCYNVEKVCPPWKYILMSLSCQPLDGSTFGVFITGETMFSQVLFQDRKQTKITGCQILAVWGMVCFPNELLHNKL